MVCESTSPNIAASRPGHSAYVQRRRLNRFLLTINTTYFIFNKRVMNQTFVFPLTDRFYIFPTRVSDPRYVDRSSRFDYSATSNLPASHTGFDTIDNLLQSLQSQHKHNPIERGRSIYLISPCSSSCLISGPVSRIEYPYVSQISTRSLVPSR